jgi:hypothetical protein
LTGNAGDPFTFELTPVNIEEEEFAYLVWECGDV